MKLAFLPLDRLSVSPTNMRHGRKAPDVADILPSIRARGVLQTLLVRPNCAPDAFEIVAGRRRYHAALIVAEERRAAGKSGSGDIGSADTEAELLPCAILDDGDDAAAIEASLIENVARLDADEVEQWVTFTRLIREGRSPEDIAATFGLPDLAVKRVLALGNLLPRIRTLYVSDAIDRVTIRHLTLASKRQQQEWLRLVDDPEARAPTGAQARAWLLGGQAIATGKALFDVAASGLVTVTDLFGEDSFFADSAAFWTAQDAAIAARRDAYLADGWSDVVIVPPSDHFHSWEYEKAAKRKGGRVYIDIHATGEVTFHEGYVSRREAGRAARAEATPGEKPKRPELTSAQQTYVDLHRHVAVRAALTAHPGVALRVMVAHLIVGSPLWTVRREPQAARDPATGESVEASRGEAVFGERRRAAIALLGIDAERGFLVGGGSREADLVGLLLRLLDCDDAALGAVIAVAMGETLAAGGAAIDAIGLTLGLDMADWWQPDPAFFALARDRQVLGAMVAEVAGDVVAEANAKETGKTLKRILADHLDGVGGRNKVEHWVPKWMAFPPSAYTDRGGVGTVIANAVVAAAKRASGAASDPGEADVASVPGPSDADTGAANVARMPAPGNADTGASPDALAA